MSKKNPIFSRSWLPLVLTFCFVLMISFESIAQIDRNHQLYALKIEKYRKMKNIGTKLTVTGGVLFIAGISMIVDAFSSSNYHSTSAANSKANTGEICALLGEASLGAGIPLWIVGAHAQKKYERRFESLSVGFNITPTQTGMRLRFRF